MLDNKANVVKSPRLAAIGVATLSGLIWHLRESITTRDITTPTVEIINNYQTPVYFKTVKKLYSVITSPLKLFIVAHAALGSW